MPNLDGGHYFFTALVPVLGTPVARGDGSITAASHALREALASLPTAAQSAACLASGRRSPFARCRRTHFARLVVIDAPMFNGRDPADAIVASLTHVDLLAPQAADGMAYPWLLVVFDFDANGDAAPDAYLRGLWERMAPELAAIFQYCFGFAGIASAAGFADYLIRCQVETTMPFNDYWRVPFAPPSVSLTALGGMALGGAAGLALLGGIALGWAGASAAWLALGIPAALAASLYLTYRFVMTRGRRPFPTAPDADLRSVLKALFVQQRFGRFAAVHQRDDGTALHAAFGALLDELRLDDLDAPTRVPGEIAA